MRQNQESTASQIRRAVALCADRRFGEAVAILHNAVRQSPDSFDAWLLLAQLELRQERYDIALMAASNATTLRNTNAAAHYTMGRIYKSRGDLQSAAECYGRAIDANPDDPDVLTSLGITLRALGRIDEAIAAYRAALAINPHHAEANNNLGNAIALRDSAEARQHHDRGGSILSAELSAMTERIRQLHQEGRLDEALECYRDAQRIAPDDATICLYAARLAQQMGKEHVSLPSFEKAVRLSYAAVDAARSICVVKGLYERALHYSRLAYELQPSSATLIAMKLLIPAIQQSVDSINRTRSSYERNLDEILASDLRIDGPDGVIGVSAFYLAYHGRNDRELQTKAARMYLKVMPSLSMTAAHCTSKERRPGRIRVGFISRFLYAHSIGKTTRGLVERLSREHFEVFVVRIPPTREDATSRSIDAAADRTVVLEEDFFRARQQVAALELDILFYQDIGMEFMSYFLAFARLASVQCVSFGHPNTTGIPNMDYFISNDLYEIPTAQTHYSERLFLLHDLPTLAYYHRPTRRPEPIDRTEFDLPRDATIYLCPQTLFKLHPDFDELLRAILRRDVNGEAVLIAAQFDDYTAQLRERFMRAMPEVAGRVRFVPPMDNTTFLELLSVADVVLDPTHFNGMNSSLECLAVGTPIVTLPTELQRGRHTQAMYRKMGILDCIAADAQHYVDIAVRLGTDRAYAGSMRERILARNAVLFEDAEVVREFERFFRFAHEEKCRSRGCF